MLLLKIKGNNNFCARVHNHWIYKIFEHEYNFMVMLIVRKEKIAPKCFIELLHRQFIFPFANSLLIQQTCIDQSKRKRKRNKVFSSDKTLLKRNTMQSPVRCPAKLFRKQFPKSTEIWLLNGCTRWSLTPKLSRRFFFFLSQ